MVITMRRAGIAAFAVWAGALSGCAGGPETAALIVRPGKYMLYNCEQIAATGMSHASRERQLKALMDKAAQGPGGEIAIALAYRNEYLTAQGNLRELEAVAAEKNCKTPWRPVSDGAVR